MTFELKDVLTIISFVATVIAFYFAAMRRIDKKVNKDDFQETLESNKTHFQETINGIRGDIQNGMKEIVDVYHEIDKKQIEIEIRLKQLERSA